MTITKQELLEERARRYKLFQEAMTENKLDALLFSSFAMAAEQLQLKYATNYRQSTRRALIFIEKNKTPKLILPTAGQKFTAGKKSWLEPDDILTADDINQMAADLIESIPGSPRIGVVNFNNISLGAYKTLSQTKAEFVEIAQQFVEKYAPKSEMEIKFVKEASDLAVASFEYIVRQIKVGMSDTELMGGAEGFCFSNGADETLLLSRSEKPHTFIGGPTGKIIGPDDVFVYSVELSGKFHYWSQLVRPIFMSEKAHQDAYEIWKIILEAEAAGVRAFRPGNRICDLAEAVEEVIDRHGCKMGVWSGHGMGVDLGDGIDIGRPNKMQIVPNMVVTLHPSVQGETDGLLYGNTYLSTKGDAIPLTGKYQESPYFDYFKSVIL